MKKSKQCKLSEKLFLDDVERIREEEDFRMEIESQDYEEEEL